MIGLHKHAPHYIVYTVLALAYGFFDKSLSVSINFYYSCVAKILQTPVLHDNTNNKDNVYANTQM